MVAGICPECEVSCVGEASVRCSRCHNDFHAACVGAAADQIRWTCAPCAVNAARCASCQVYQPVEETTKCAAPGCARVLCTKCKPSNDEWTCGAHACGACGRVLDDRDGDAVRCVRCPRGFCRGCRPASAAPVSTNAFRCVAHVREVRAPFDVGMMRRRRRGLRGAAVVVDDFAGADEFAGAEFSSDDEAPGDSARADLAARARSGFSEEGAVAVAPPPAARLPRKRRRAPSPPAPAPMPMPMPMMPPHGFGPPGMMPMPMMPMPMQQMPPRGGGRRRRGRGGGQRGSPRGPPPAPFYGGGAPAPLCTATCRRRPSRRPSRRRRRRRPRRGPRSRTCWAARSRAAQRPRAAAAAAGPRADPPAAAGRPGLYAASRPSYRVVAASPGAGSAAAAGRARGPRRGVPRPGDARGAGALLISTVDQVGN